MKYLSVPWLVIALLMVGSVTAATHPRVTADQLIAEAGEYNGRTVVIRGEAFGDIMTRGSMGWVNVLSEGVGIGIWADTNQLAKIRLLGSYRYRGDIAEVTGIFNRACSQHGGEPDIHALSLDVVEAGSPIARPLQAEKIRLAAALVPITVIGVLSATRRRVKSNTNSL
ncbi:MAG: hypothetical protein ACM3ZQ_04295 [Bacillota bacterium]